jgi:hypothetical protein
MLLPDSSDDVITLAGTGPAVWELLAEWRSSKDLAAILADAFGSSAALVAADLGPLLAELESKGAVEAAADSGGPEPE